MTAATISVIVPTLNAAQYLPDALQSICAQEMPSLEVLVIDGGSTDDTVRVASAFARLRVIRQQGRGLASARNEGLQQASGEYISFLDADDCWTKGKLRTQLAFLQAHSVFPAVIGHMIRFETAVEAPPMPHATGLLEHPVPAYTPGALLARRSAFDGVGRFDETLEIGCDSDWFARTIASDSGLVVLPQVVLRKRIHARNLSLNTERYRLELLTIARRAVSRRHATHSPSNDETRASGS